MQAIHDEFGHFDEAPNFQIHVLSSLFFRNKSAYIVGRIINADRVLPFAVPIRHVRPGVLALDTVLLRRDQLMIIFGFSHSYFLVDMGVPSAYVDFLCTIMPGKPKAEIYVGRAAEAGQEPVLSRPAAPSVAFERPLHHRARDQGPRDARVHAAVVPVRVQDHQDQFPPPKKRRARRSWRSTSS